ncbi:MAG: aromatic compounds degradation protein paaI [Acidimicrobiales bacterium]|nr:aromatic compounds degradation protein paaI [Acidimicrobiales bacterium]
MPPSGSIDGPDRLAAGAGSPDPLARLLRDLERRAIGPNLDADQRRRLADDLAGVVARLDGPRGPTSRYGAADRAHLAQGGDTLRCRYASHPVHGPQHPGSLVTDVRLGEATIDVSVMFDLRHEGPPGRVHGVYAGGLFDYVLGRLAIARCGPGVTAEVTVRFQAPMPTGAVVRYAGSVGERLGRKTRLAGTANDAHGRVLATAAMLFVHPRA